MGSSSAAPLTAHLVGDVDNSSREDAEGRRAGESGTLVLEMDLDLHTVFHDLAIDHPCGRLHHLDLADVPDGPGRRRDSLACSIAPGTRTGADHLSDDDDAHGMLLDARWDTAGHHSCQASLERSGNRWHGPIVLGPMRTIMPPTTYRLGAGLAIAAVLAAGSHAAAQTPPASPGSPPGSQGSPVTLTYPQGPTDVVLRMATGGGFIQFTYGLTQAPEFTLYGDGTAVFRPSVDPSGSGFPPFMQTTLSADEIQALLTFALGPGGLADARAAYDHRLITDQPTTVFTVDTDQVDKTVSVYALGRTPPGGPDDAAYQSFQALGDRLTHFGATAIANGDPAFTLYQPSQYRAYLSPATDDSTTALSWPWADLTLEDFQAYGDHEDVVLGGLTPDQAAAVTRIPSGGVPSTIILAPDGTTRLTLTIRPLLPGEPLDPLAPTPS